MHDCWDMVRCFHAAFALPIAESPRRLGRSRALTRAKWMREELSEFVHAVDLCDQADALLDLIYLALGTFVEMGIDPAELSDQDLFRELGSLHRTRLNTLRHGPDAALENHFKRTAELETEYLARYPAREVDPDRLARHS